MIVIPVFPGGKMIVAFCGHSEYMGNSEDERKVLEYLERRVGNKAVEFYLGEYGGFDRFAYTCARKYQETHSAARLVFISPYLSEAFLKKHIESSHRFDAVLYPNLENVPPRYAISYRNRWIAEQAEVLISYVVYSYGGASKMYRYAVQKGKEIYNLAGLQND